MSKEKKKTPLMKESIFIPFGIMFEEDVPDYHIDGRTVTAMQYKMHLETAENKKRIYLKSPALKKLADKIKRNGDCYTPK